jgi:hypothetical protein
MKIYDIRDYFSELEAEESKAIFLVGGFIGELVLTFNAMYNLITASPGNADFMFTVEMIEKFLSEILPEDYPADIATLKVEKDPIASV